MIVFAFIYLIITGFTFGCMLSIIVVRNHEGSLDIPITALSVLCILFYCFAWPAIWTYAAVETYKEFHR